MHPRSGPCCPPPSRRAATSCSPTASHGATHNAPTTTIARLDLEARAAEVRRDGYAVNTQDDATSLAVPVPMEPAPLAALVVSSDTHGLSDHDHEALVTVLRDTAAQLNDAQSRPQSRRA
jgi:DNA-binding IclR family transcriptional regulator